MKLPTLLAVALFAALAAGAADRDARVKPDALTKAEDVLNRELAEAEKEYLNRRIKAYEAHRDALEAARKELTERGKLADAVAIDEARREAVRQVDTLRSQLPRVLQKTPAVISVAGAHFQTAELRNGERAFSNRGYVWDGVPEALQGWSFTRVAGNGKPDIRVTVKKTGVVVVAVAEGSKYGQGKGWEPVEGQGFCYTSQRRERVVLLARQFAAGEVLDLPQDGGFTGTIVLLPPGSK